MSNKDTFNKVNETLADFEILLDPNADANDLAQLAKKVDFALRVSVYNHRNATPKIRRKLRDAERVLVHVMTTTSSEILIKQYATSQHVKVLRTIASNKHTPGDALHQLSKSPDSFVRQVVAENSNASKSILNRLIRDPYLVVGTAAASNPNLRVKDVLYLALNSKHEALRKAAARNPQCPEWLSHMVFFAC